VGSNSLHSSSTMNRRCGRSQSCTQSAAPAGVPTAVSAAVATGCSVILKGPEETPGACAALIQAYIFMLLTMIYVSQAVAHDH